MSKKNPYAAKTAKEVRKPAKKAEKSVVDGTIKEVLAWVSEDPEKAKQALEEENAKDSPRSTLVKSLEELLETEEDN